MKRHILAAFLAAACAASLFAGCGGSGDEDIIIKDSKPSAEVAAELRLFGYKTDTYNLLAIEKTFVSFLEKYSSLNVIYESTKESEYYPALERRRATGNLSDAFMLNSEIYHTMKSQNKLADISSSFDVNAFAPDVKEQIKEAGGKVFFIPCSVSSYNLYVNYDLLARENITVPENLTQFAAACSHFVSKGVTPVVIDSYYSLSSLIEVKGLYSVYQGNDTGEKIASFNDNPSLLYDYLSCGVDLVSQMVDGKWVSRTEGLVTKNAQSEIDLFVKGGRPFMIASGQNSRKVKEAFSAENPRFNYGMLAYPVLDDGAALAIDLDTCIAVNPDGENTQRTKDLISFMAEPSALYDYSESQSSFSPLADCPKPSDRALAPSYDYYVSGKTVVLSDYRLEVKDFDEIVYECGNMLLCGESKEAVKNYLKAELVKAGGSKI